MGKLFKNEIKVGTEFYMINNNETLSYDKCIVFKIYKMKARDGGIGDRYYFKRKREQHKRSTKFFLNRNIVANRVRLFEEKIDMLLYIDYNREYIPEVIEREIIASRKKFAEYWI